MTLTLNKILNDLDKIIFHDYKEDDNNKIKSILDNVRKYIINTYKNKDLEDIKLSFIKLMEFINYLIQESDIVTCRYINQILGLRYLILKFEENTFIIDEEDINIDFVEKNGYFLNKYLKSEIEND